MATDRLDFLISINKYHEVPSEVQETLLHMRLEDLEISDEQFATLFQALTSTPMRYDAEYRVAGYLPK